MPPPHSLSLPIPLFLSMSHSRRCIFSLSTCSTETLKDPKIHRKNSCVPPLALQDRKLQEGGGGGGSSTRVSRLERRIELRSGGDPGYPPHGNTRGARSALPSARPLLACLSVRSFLTACLSVCFFLSVSVCDCLPFGDLCAGLWRQGGAVSNYCLTSKSVKMYRI